MKKSRNDHLFGKGPKRILSLDGGGIRGIITLGVLKRIEEILGSRYQDPDFVLSDYFDLVGGTSTGAIIAGGLAMGWPVSKISDLYDELGESIFERDRLRWGFLRAKFSQKPLQKALENAFGKSTTLGSDELQTGLALVLKRLDTNSPWILHNNPRGKYFDRRLNSKAVPNREFSLVQVIRASTAAPHYFDPEAFEVADEQKATFVDGGVSPHNNPALQLLMLASLEGYGLQWPLGADNILLTSIGTGSSEREPEPPSLLERIRDGTAAGNAARALLSLMDDASALNETILQWLSRSPTSRRIDREVGDLGNDVMGEGAPWLTYLRYNAWLDMQRLEQIGVQLPADQVEKLTAMDDADNMAALKRVGEGVARYSVQESHFRAVFDMEKI